MLPSPSGNFVLLSTLGLKRLFLRFAGTTGFFYVFCFEITGRRRLAGYLVIAFSVTANAYVLSLTTDQASFSNTSCWSTRTLALIFRHLEISRVLFFQVWWGVVYAAFYKTSELIIWGAMDRRSLSLLECWFMIWHPWSFGSHGTLLICWSRSVALRSFSFVVCFLFIFFWVGFWYNSL